MCAVRLIDPVAYARAEMHCAQAAEERVRNGNYTLRLKITELESQLRAAEEREGNARDAALEEAAGIAERYGNCGCSDTLPVAIRRAKSSPTVTE